MPVVSNGHPQPALSALSRETTSAPVSDANRDETPMDFGLDYHVKQYGTNALLSGGTIAAGVFIFAPEPIITKIIGGSIALSCIVAGGVGKHYMYRGAYIHEAIEKAVNKIEGQIETLGTEIRILEATEKGLEVTNARLERTREIFQRQLNALQSQIGRLDSNVGDAFEQLNRDRQAFEEEKNTKLAQLSDEILEADARGDRAQFKLERLDEREAVLVNLVDELNARREKLVGAEAELRDMQARLLEVCADEPGLLSRLPDAGGTSLVPESLAVMPEGAVRSEGVDAVVMPDDQAVQNLKVLAELSSSRGAKLHVESDGHFDIQRAGFFTQSMPRSFQDGASVTSRSHFFRPVFNFFHNGKTVFASAELQQAFNGICSMRQTYSGNVAKSRILRELIQVIAADNPALHIPGADSSRARS